MSLYVGKQCPQCGGFSRYVADDRCVACRLESGRKSHKKRRSTKDDYRAGVPQGFVRFGTLAELILKAALEDGYVSNCSIKLRLERGASYPHTPEAVSTTIMQLVKYKFLFKVGSDRIPGRRSFAVFSLNRRPTADIPQVEKLSPKERTKNYRALKKVKVNSVFNWRGQHESELSERVVSLDHGAGEHPQETRRKAPVAVDDRYRFGAISLLQRVP